MAIAPWRPLMAATAVLAAVASADRPPLLPYMSFSMPNMAAHLGGSRRLAYRPEWRHRRHDPPVLVFRGPSSSPSFHPSSIRPPGLRSGGDPWLSAWLGPRSRRRGGATTGMQQAPPHRRVRHRPVAFLFSSIFFGLQYTFPRDTASRPSSSGRATRPSSSRRPWPSVSVPFDACIKPHLLSVLIGLFLLYLLVLYLLIFIFELSPSSSPATSRSGSNAGVTTSQGVTGNTLRGPSRLRNLAFCSAWKHSPSG